MLKHPDAIRLYRTILDAPDRRVFKTEQGKKIIDDAIALVKERCDETESAAFENLVTLVRLIP